MKPTAHFAILAILCALAHGLLVLLKSPLPNAPRFTKAQTPAAVTFITYDFLSPRPFVAGKMWLFTGRESLIYDLETRRVLGQVANAGPAMLFGDPPRLLCYQPTSLAGPMALRERLLTLLSRISRGRIKAPPSTPGQTYWILDLANNAATRLGDIPDNPNTFFPSPDFHYCFTTRIGQGPSPEVYLLDLQNRSIHTLGGLAWACDWWDNTHILVETTNRDLVLYDTRNQATSPLIGAPDLAAFLKQNGSSADPSQAHPFAIWNGRENDFYLTDTHQKWLAEDSFLIKVERPDGKLRLISPRFKFEWSDHLDPAGKLYLYSGRDAGDASDGVFLRDLDAGTNRVLVAPTTDKYMSIPRFYRDSVIYLRSNALWQISLDGSNNTRLFPPTEKHVD